MGVQHQVKNDIYKLVELEPEFHFMPSIKKFAGTAYIKWVSISIQLSIDVCVTAALWRRAN
jgi:hypothetical protein